MVACGCVRNTYLYERLLEDPRRAAVEEHGQDLELLGDRRDREAAARRDVADDRIDVLALHEVAQLGDLGGRAARLVDVDRLDLEPGDSPTLS